MSSHKILPSKKDLKLSLKNRVELLQARAFKQKNGFSSYSIVAACYNVEKYLDDFVSSIVNQRLSFKDNIELILVDDGSKDSTLKIAKDWERRYPDGIKVLTKENGGQASARNLGLLHAKNAWVSFADPDDYFSYDAFYEVDRQLKLHADHDIAVVTLRPIAYKEAQHDFVPSANPIYAEEYTLKRIRDFDDRCCQGGTNLALLRRDLLVKDDLKYDERCRPCGEDIKLINSFFMHNEDKYDLFLRQPRYYYRIRADHSSTVDNAAKNRANYGASIEYCMFPLYDEAKALLGRIPCYLQHIAVYGYSINIRKLLDHDEITDFLSAAEKVKFLDSLTRIFRECDAEAILDCNVYPTNDIDCFSILAVGILGRFKNERPSHQILFLDAYDEHHDALRIHYHSFFDPEREEYRAGGTVLHPEDRSRCDHVFIGERFVTTHSMWLSLKDLPEDAVLNAVIDTEDVRFCVNGALLDAVTLNDLKTSLRREFIDESSPYAHAWLIYGQGNDGVGTELYRHLRNTHPEIRTFLVVDKHSPDWQSLKREGIALLEHHGKQHKQALRNCDNVIISDKDGFTFGYYWGNKPGRNKPQLIFIHSPENHDDLRAWIDSVRVDLMIGNASDKGSAIAKRFTQKEFAPVDWQIPSTRRSSSGNAASDLSSAGGASASATAPQPDFDAVCAAVMKLRN